MSLEHRIQFLEQKVTVMQKEISEVLGEMQQALTAMVRSQAIAASASHYRLTELEKLTGLKQEEARTEEGKEI